MKTLIINQPYASLVCNGLENVVHMKVPPSEIPCRLYIFADVQDNGGQTPLEWQQEVINQQLFGNLDYPDELPTKRLIGFVDVVRAVPHDFNLWSRCSSQQAYLVSNARAFVMPLHIKPCDVEQNLDFIERVNTRILIPRRPYFTDGESELVLPVNESLYCMALGGANFSLQLTGEFAALVTDERGMLKPFTKYTLWHGNEGTTFVVDDDTEIVHELNDDGSDLRRYHSALSPDGVTTRATIRFSCRYRL